MVNGFHFLFLFQSEKSDPLQCKTAKIKRTEKLLCNKTTKKEKQIN